MKFFIQKLNSIIQSLNYDYNTIGNRLLVCQNDLLIQGDYNSWNQLTNRFFHGDLGYFGTATATNSRLLTTLFVDGTNLINSTTNKHEFTRIFHLLNTKSGNLNTNNSKLGNYCYDANGNLTNDGEHSYSYNMENRLTKCSTSVSLVNYSYDGLGRKVKSKEINLTTGKTNETKFIYNNWNVIGEITTSQLHRLTSSYFWGNDLSGSLHGAGGIGGLLANSPFSKGGGGGFYFYNYDANGNVINLIDSEGETAAHYEYSPFGKTISKTGYYAETNKFRFSTKRFEEVGELYYYGFRYYKPKTGNWLTRDPIEELGGLNIYSFVNNNTINNYDINGEISIITIGAIVALIEAIIHKSIYDKAFDAFPFDCQDRQRHCWVNCISVKIHMGNSAAALAASILKEIRDLIAGGNWIDTVNDMVANVYGSLMFDWLEPCKKTCKCPVGARSGSCCDPPRCD